MILVPDAASGGSSGWQAPEQLSSEGVARLGRGVDIFSYGLLLHYCLTGGKHAFGHPVERDYNIMHVRYPSTETACGQWGWPACVHNLGHT